MIVNIRALHNPDEQHRSLLKKASAPMSLNAGNMPLIQPMYSFSSLCKRRMGIVNMCTEQCCSKSIIRQKQSGSNKGRA